MIGFALLSPTRVYAEWGWLRNGLLDLAERTEAHYRPEDAWLRLRTGTAWAYGIGAVGDEIGFAILTQEHDPDGLCVFVWAIWCEPGSAAGVKDDIYAGLEMVARAAGAKRIRMQSPRPGWERERFFSRVAVVYEHEVMQ